MRLLELINQEYLLSIKDIPPITISHKERMLINIKAFKPKNASEKLRKENVIKKLNLLKLKD